MFLAEHVNVRGLSGKLRVFAFAALLTASVSDAQAPSNALQVDFSKAVTLSATEAPGVWYTDRYAPCAFTSPATAPKGAKAALQESICQGDLQPAPSFYNTQGRKTDLAAGATTTSITLYVPDSWSASPQRFAGIWDTTINSANVVGNDYGIIEFQGPIPAGSPIQGPGFYANGGTAGFYGWDNVNSKFVYIGLPVGFKYNTFVTLTITLIPTIGFSYAVSPVATATVTPPASASATSGTFFYDSTETAISNTILEGYNYGINYSIYWENFYYFASSLTCKKS